VKRTDLAGVSPKETVSNYLTAPAAGLDLLSLIYRVRLSGGVGSFMLSEGDRNYPVTLQPVGGERVKTDAGEFDTTIASVESEYFTELGLKGLRINFSNDEARLPVLVRFRSLKGDFRATLSGIHLVEPEPETVPTPAPQPTPRVTATPRPAPSPTPYIENLPLAPELGFSLGETLRYRVSAGGRTLGEIALRVKERKQFKGEDTLLLSIDVTAAEQGNGAFSLGDSIVTHVDPETLVPRDLIVRASGPLSFLNRSADFDQRSGTITFAGSPPVDAPVGTHNIVSLLYAIRSFNLKPSKDMNNPVNDTRVAVFWHEKAYVFTLRPGDAESLTINEKNISAQRIAVNTGVSSLDQGGIKIWLSNDSVRRPVRFSFGVYQADLIHEPKTQLK
jgi:hypothetical protein